MKEFFDTATTIVFYLAFLVSLFTYVLLLIRSFMRSVWWGLACLLLNPAMLVYLILYWKDHKELGYTIVASSALILLCWWANPAI